MQIGVVKRTTMGKRLRFFFTMFSTSAGKVTVGPQQADAVRKGAGSVIKESDLGSKGWDFQSVGSSSSWPLEAGGDNVIPLEKRGASDG
jgi:hypothetical protein